MPLHPQIRTLLDEIAAAGAPPLTSLRPSEVRASYQQMARQKPASAAVIGGTRDLSAPGPAGTVPLRAYTPMAATGPFPLLVYFHGGGFVIGNLDTHDDVCRELCAGTGCVVVSVDYRLAPEHKFPAASDDGLAATRWVAEHAAELNGDAARLAIGGDSAGGNLATVTALRIRDEGGPQLCGQMLVYPVTDHYSADMPSMRDNGTGYGLAREEMVWYSDHYLRDDADIDNPRASPLRAPSLRGLPPAWVGTAEFDPLRDEGEAYAKRLAAEGVPTAFKRYDGAIHGIYTYASGLELGRQVMDDSCAWLRQRFEIDGTCVFPTT